MSLDRHDKLLINWMLTLVLMMTPWLSFWTTPFLGQNQNGEQVILCTLQGLQTVTLDQQGNLLEKPAEHCSALQLLKAFNQTAHADIHSATHNRHPAQLSIITPDYLYSVPHLSVYIGRAPPVT